MENIIYHITTLQEWNVAKTKGFYEAVSLSVEGFIHCSLAAQVDGVLERYFKGKPDLVKLTIDTSKLNNVLKYELAPSVNEVFPHIYGTLNLDAVIEVASVRFN
ncbi:MAG: DUF952 domain-containing protein [Bacteroidota bacterium]|nr:DUF952 domain-containing protein [Bacteroidota bacterium]